MEAGGGVAPHATHPCAGQSLSSESSDSIVGCEESVKSGRSLLDTCELVEYRVHASSSMPVSLDVETAEAD